MNPAGHCTRPWWAQAGAKTCPANLPRSAKEWARFPWQTSGRSHCPWAPAPPLSLWRTARCPEHPCSRWPGAKQHKDCSNARLHDDATTANNRGSWLSAGTYIWLEGGVQHACFQPPEVEVLEERVLLHFLGPSSSAPQALQWVFAQELQHKGNQCPGWSVLWTGAALRSAGLL